MTWIQYVQGAAKSITNDHQASLVGEFVIYLLHGNDYSSGDVAALPPYFHQLAILREIPSTNSCVRISEQDKDSLDGAGDFDFDDLNEKKKLSASMCTCIRLVLL